MLLSDWRVLVRRWYVVLAGVLVTAGLCLLIMSAVPVQYEANSKTLMLPPQQKVNGLPTNPYLNLGGLDGMTDVLASAMSDASVQKKMTDAGHVTAIYEFTRDQTAAGPVVLLKVTDNSRAEALASQKFLLEQMAPVLEGLQQQVNVPTSTYITKLVFTQDDDPATSRKQQLRLLLVGGVGGLGGTYLAAALLDGLLRSRRKPPAGASQNLAPPMEPRRAEMPSLAGIGQGAPNGAPGPRQPGAGRPQQGPLQGSRQDSYRPVEPGRGPGPGRPAGSYGPSNGYSQDRHDTSGHNGQGASYPPPAGRQGYPDQGNGQPYDRGQGRKQSGRNQNGDQGQGGLNWLP